MATIAVDMTPVLPGGDNGGAKVVALELLRHFRTMAEEDQFLVLTASWNHEELSFLDARNIKRLCVLKKQQVRKPLARLWDGNVGRLVLKSYRALRQRFWPWMVHGRPLASRGVDLLFCPFTAVTYAEPGISVVSIIHDLQHRDYPQFFTPHEVDHRDAFLSQVSRRADAIVCVSEFTRQAVIKYLKTGPERVHTIHNCTHTRLRSPDPSKASRDLQKLGIHGRRYMFYPANFWGHKNHKMLLTAYGMLLAGNPGQEIDLVFTGALDDSQQEIKEAAYRMGLEGRVHFLGFLPQGQLVSVWHGCEFLIFPSLYEGFGMPVLEAMHLGKPVLCSNVTSLPEVAGDAALYFDPRRPAEIVRCMERIMRDEALRSHLIQRGRERARSFRPEDMARRYLEIFYSAMESDGHFQDTVTGIFQDAWTGSEMVVLFGPGKGDRLLEIRLHAPPWLPHRSVHVKVESKGRLMQKHKIARGENLTIIQELPDKAGSLSVLVKPVFVPSKHDMGEDDRALGLLCRGCWLSSEGRKRISLFEANQ